MSLLLGHFSEMVSAVELTPSPPLQSCMLIGPHRKISGYSCFNEQQQAGPVTLDDAIRDIVKQKRNLAHNLAKLALFRLNIEFVDVSNAGDVSNGIHRTQWVILSQSQLTPALTYVVI
jgi:hypothetical protein